MTVRLIPGQGMYANGYITDGTILVDAGVTPMALEAYRSTLKYIILTHCHYDHIAYLPQIKKMTRAQICIFESDAPGLTDDRISLSMNFGAHAPGIIPDILLSDDEVIEGYTVMHTPGHTTGSICLYNPETYDLISGDTVFSDGAFGRYDFPGGSRDTLEQSLTRLGTIRVEGLYPGHGLPVRDNGSRHINAALRRIQTDRFF